MVTKRYDVTVIGAGAAGIAAAICSARAGRRTLLIEKEAFPGGTVVKGAITTLCGLYLNTGTAPQLMYDGFTAAFTRDLMKMDGVNEPLRMGKLYVLPFRPDSFKRLAVRLTEHQKDLQVLYSAELTDLTTTQNRIQCLQIRTADQSWHIETETVIDCSGNAVVARLAGQNVMQGDVSRQSPAVMIPVVNVAGSLESPARRIQILAALQRSVTAGNLPKEAAAVAFMPSLDAETIVLKLNLGFTGIESNRDDAAPRRRAAESAAGLMAFLQTHVAEFAQSRIIGDRFPVLYRSSTRPVGKYVLNGQDVIHARIFPDAAAKGCWPIEKWDANGRQHLRYLPPGEWYDIPCHALQAQGLENLLMAGKTISADDDAIASARVIGCCLATGEAAGRMAGRRP